MSEFIHVECEIRDMAVMKDTLKEMGHDFAELKKGEVVEIQRRYNNIAINSITGKIDGDSADRGIINKIAQTYMVNFFKDRAVKEGVKYQIQQEANGKVSIQLG